MHELNTNTIFDRLLRSYFYGNIHISIIAGSCYYLYNRHWKHSIIVMLCTFFYYNFCSIIYVKDYDLAKKVKRLAWVSLNLTELLITIGSALIIIGLLMSKYEPFFHERLDYKVVASCLILCIIYFKLRHTKFIKNILIAVVWILVMHLWEKWDMSYFDGFLFCFLFLISFMYDKSTNEYRKIALDTSILMPFMLYYLIKYYNHYLL